MKKSSILILLSTYNGEKYLKEQLDSLFSQTYKDIKIVVRDDGSVDGTLEFLQSYDVKLLKSYGNIGIKRSFSLLLEYALHNSDCRYFMFCDQDDIWKKDKVEKTLIKMQELQKSYGNMPLLVNTNLEVVDENLYLLDRSFMNYQNINARHIRLSRLLLQNTITGCTIMINRKLAELAIPIPDRCIMHDWWLGLIASQLGRIGYIEESTIKYRQHLDNSIGAKKFTLRYIIERFTKSHELSKNILQAKAFLNKYKDLLDDRTISMLEDFSNINNKSFFQKRVILLKYKLFKQGFLRNLGLLLKI